MKNAWGLICMILLVVTTSTALPSDEAADKKTGKPETKKAVVPAKAVEPAKTVNSVKKQMVVPAFHWFGPALDKKNPLNKDKC
ncbi:hypothetical protein [Dyadobacter aurulentus]|uniref:hypothetical protein n=1 Tax=Dyadobacter sp. UC 10 TaxID=2605428 RepID=UPI0011F37DE8|nr:hypothetical protein [Dyadobacter sp. UC 10]KAA0989546.1 hypothetical protein FXO21_04895 [Dyadobacter sp. UC 10]